MFILPAGNNVWLNLAAIVASCIVLGFTLIMIWIALIEINLFITSIREERAAARAEKEYFKQIEEMRNDFS